MDPKPRTAERPCERWIRGEYPFESPDLSLVQPSPVEVDVPGFSHPVAGIGVKLENVEVPAVKELLCHLTGEFGLHFSSISRSCLRIASKVCLARPLL